MPGRPLLLALLALLVAVVGVLLLRGAGPDGGPPPPGGLEASIVLEAADREPVRVGVRPGQHGVEVVMRERCRGEERDVTLSAVDGAGVDRLEPLDLGDGSEAVAFSVRSGAAARLLEAAVVRAPDRACDEPRRLFSYPRDAGHDGMLLADASFQPVGATGDEPAGLVVREGLVRRGEPLCCPTRMRTLRLRLEGDRFEVVDRQEGRAPPGGTPEP